MPGYIGYRPQFNPISLQEYLTVPTMIIEGRQREADKIEQYKNEAEKWRTLMGDSPEAKALWENYDKELNNLGDDIMANRAGDIARTARRLADTYRGIKYKAEEAYEKQKKYQDMLDKNPNLIGNAGTLMDYYGKDYTPSFIDSKDLSTTIGGIVAPEASTRLPRFLGNQGGLDYYTTGIPEQEIRDNITKAITGNPDNNMSSGISDYLNRIDYSNLDPKMQAKVLENIYKSALANSGVGMTTVDPLKQEHERASIESARASAAYHRTQNRIAKESLPQEWDDINEYNDTDTTSKRYKYRQKKHASGEIYIERSPLVKKNGKWVQKDATWWQPAPSYKRDGEVYSESIKGTGIYGGNTTIDGSDYQNKTVSYVADEEKGKLSNAAPDSQTVLDDTENYEEIDYNKDKQSRQVATLKNIAKGEGYSEDQLQFRWDKKNKRVIVVITGIKTPEPTKTQATQIKQQQTQGQTNSDKLVSSTSYEEQK